MKDKTVYVVYDQNSSFFAVYDSEEKACDVIEYMGMEDFTIRKTSLNPGHEAMRRRLGCFHVLMLRDGSVERIEERNQYRYLSIGNRSFLWNRPSVKSKEISKLPVCLSADVWARNKKHAIKIANESRVQKIASGEWE